MVFQSSGITFQCTKDSNLSRFSPWPVFYLPAYSHSSMCEVIPQWFWFELSRLLMMSFLSCAYRVFYVFFGEMCIEILYLFPVGVSGGFFFLVIDWKSSIYTLDTSSFSDTWFAKIFSHSLSCLFTFLMVFLEVQKFQTLVKSSLRTVFYCYYTFSIIPKKF